MKLHTFNHLEQITMGMLVRWIISALIGAIIGAAIWAGITYFTNYEIVGSLGASAFW